MGEAEDPIALARMAAAHIARVTGAEGHEIAVVLGTGLSDAAHELGTLQSEVTYGEIPGFPPVVPEQQRADLWSTVLEGRRLLVMRGRPHLYEGHSAQEVAHPVRAAIMSGCTVLILTNSSGAIRRDLRTGQVALISDHLNLTGVSPLSGRQARGASVVSEAMSPFVDLTDAWSPRLRDLAREEEPTLQEGVYAQVPGPNFETPAEVRMLRGLGADMVGMSSALEAIAARHLGVEVAGLSVVTNAAAGASDETVEAGSVVEAARSSAERLGLIVRGLVLRVLAP